VFIDAATCICIYSISASELQCSKCVLLTKSDRMTECTYTDGGIKSFAPSAPIHGVRHIPVLERGLAILAEQNAALGLAMDSQDLAYYLNLFVNDLHRDPTGQSTKLYIY
jgi:hypothetical protein